MWNHGCLCMLLTKQRSHWSPAHDPFAWPCAPGWRVCIQSGEPFALPHSGTVHLSSGIPAGRKWPFADLHKDATRALSDLGQMELKCKSYALKSSEFQLVIKVDVLFSRVELCRIRRNLFLSKNGFWLNDIWKLFLHGKCVCIHFLEVCL